MTEKPPPRPPKSAAPPPLPKPSPRPVTGEATAPKKSAPPPLPKKNDDDGGATKLFSGNLGEEAELVVVQGEFQGRTIKLGAGTVVIGRSSECDLVLKAASGVSRRHCKVQYLGNRFVVVDLESRNGTIVNGQSVERKVLENGDKIEVGDELLQFVVHSMADLRAPLADDANIENLPTQQLPQAVSLPPAPPVPLTQKKPPATTELPETLPPQRLPQPPPPVDVEPPAFLPVELPPVAPPARRDDKGAGVGFYVFGLVAVVVLGGGAFLVWDVFFRGDHDAVAEHVDAGAAAVDGGSAVAVASVVDAGSAVAVAPVVDAGNAVAVVAVDAGSPVAAAVVDAGTTTATATTATTTTATPAPAGKIDIVRANIGGKAEKVLVKVGDVLTPDTPVAVVAGESFNLRKKIDTLKAEAAELEPYVGKVPSAKSDLESVRAEIRRIEGRLKPQTLKANKKGTVLEVLVRPGDVVRDGAPILKIDAG